MGKKSKRRLVKKRIQRWENKKKRFRHYQKTPMFKDNFGNDVYAIQLTFPILRKKPDETFTTVGTGFFIHPAGGFVTAKHCLFKGEKYDDQCYGVHSISANEHFIRKIQYFEAHPIADIGVGMLRGQLKDRLTGETKLMPSFPIAAQAINIADDISTLAFPRMTIDQNQVGTFPCDKFTGKITEHLPDGTSHLKDECYATNMHIPTMASGGPTLRGNTIIGVNSTAMSLTEDDDDPISFITPISKVFEIVLKDSDGNETTIQELINSGHMPKTI